MGNLIYTVKTKKIKVSSRTSKIRINFFSDIHRDSDSCDSDRWLAQLKEWKRDETPDTYYMGIGDYHDFGSTSEKSKISKADLHDDTIKAFNKISRKENAAFAHEIRQMNGRLLGLFEGNHHWHYNDTGKTSTQELCEAMDCEYLGWLSYFVLQIEFSGKRQTAVDIVGCHGKGAGRRAGATVNGVEDLKLIFPIADLYIMGHDHQRFCRPDSILYADKTGIIKIKQREQMLMRSGSYLKSYNPSEGGYAMNALMKPANLGSVSVEIQLCRDRKDGHDFTTKRLIGIV